MNIKAVDSYSRDTHSLQSILPEEIWLLIFDKVTHPNDLQSLTSASPYFQHLLRPKRVLFLFPKVWNILAIKYHQNHFKNGAYDLFEELTSSHISPEGVEDSRRCGQCGRLSQRKRLWYCGILKLRQVCTAWNIAVDSFYQSTPPYQNELVHRHTIAWTEERFGAECQELRNSRAFLQHFEKTHGNTFQKRNPFLSRAVALVFGQYVMELTQEYLIEISNLLAQYGHHIWFCRLHITDSFPTRALCYSKIRTLLKLMPNLKVLHFTYKMSARLVFEPPSVEDMEALEQEVNFHPLPTFPLLESLRTSGLPAVVFNKLIKKNSHVSSLDIVGWNNNNNNYDIYTVPMSHLEHLSIENFTDEDFQKLESSPVVKWSLEKLKLQFHINFSVELPRVLNLLEEKWALTLTELELDLPRATECLSEIVTDRNLCRLNIQKIKRLKLNMKTFSSLDIILPMKDSLESLEITLSYYTEMGYNGTIEKDAEDGQIIQFHGWYDRLLDSNIWNIFPRLNRIWMHEHLGFASSMVRTHTRQEWDLKGLSNH